MRPGTPLLQRLLSLLLISLRQLNAPIERVKHTLELVEGRERLYSAGGEVKMELRYGEWEGLFLSARAVLAAVHGPSVMQVALRG